MTAKQARLQIEKLIKDMPKVKRGQMIVYMQRWHKLICKKQREICAKEVEGDPEVEQVIIDDIQNNVLNAPEPEF